MRDRLGRTAPCILSLWPGLPDLWRSGSVVGLAQALGFAFLLQLTVFTTLIWPETIGPVSRAVVWFCVVGFWLLFGAPVFGRAAAVLAGGFHSADHEHLFRTAQREYLRGNWFQSERILRRLLNADAGDVDSRLLLVTLYRHVGRLAAATEQLQCLDESYGSDKWRFEILQEQSALARLRRQSDLAQQDASLDEMAPEAA